MKGKKANKTELDKFEEKEIKSWSKHLIKERKKFEERYVNLYNALYLRFQVEFNNIQNLEDKCEFLQELMDEITEANHNKNNNYSIGELAENSEKSLQGLHRFFEGKMNAIYNENAIKIIKNDFPNIFKDAKAYSIFLELHSIFKNNKTKLADYSFIFHRMEKDGFILSSQVAFVMFLSEIYDLNIDKVDSRQTGFNKRTALYNAIVENKIKDFK